MSRAECVAVFVAAGMTWFEAMLLFHDQIAWRPEGERRFWVEHSVELFTEDRALRAS